MKKYLGFIDDTGVLSNDPNQRFFGLGLLKLENTAPFYEEMVRLKDRVVSLLPKLGKPFEFKFNDINKSNYGFYRDLVELYFTFPENYFCVLVLDKINPMVDIPKFFPSTWDAYISYSGLLVKKNIEAGNSICVIADFHQKPKVSTRYYESEIKNGNSDIFNVCMLESHASLYIQMVDVLTSSVVSDFRIRIDPKLQTNVLKREIVNLIRKKLGVDSLADGFTLTKPNYFSVWPFNPMKSKK